MNKRIRKKQIKKANKLEFGKEIYFSQRDIWNIGPVLAQYIYCGLKAFRRLNKHSYGVPQNDMPFSVHPVKTNDNLFADEQMNIWNKAIDDMADAFYEFANDYQHSPYNMAFNNWYNKELTTSDKMWVTEKTEDGCHRLIEPEKYTYKKPELIGELKEKDKKYYDNVFKKGYMFINNITNLWD